MPTFPEWWRWDLTFTSHAELRMEQRGVTEVVHAHRAQRPWVVILEPDADVRLLVVVTVYEVPE
jgi:hypothetical protein